MKNKNTNVEYEFHDCYRKKDGSYIVVAKVLDSPRGIFKIPAIKIVSERKDLLSKFCTDDIINIIGLAATECPPRIELKQFKHFKWFYILSMLFGCCLIASNIASFKLITILGFEMTGGMLPYSLTYVLGDIITEVYGYKRTRQLIWGSILCNLLATAFIYLAVIAPPSLAWPYQKEYALIFMGVPRIIIASMISYFVSEFLNSYVLAKLKIRHKGNKLWFRIIFSTLVAITVDNFLFLSIAYQNILTESEMAQFSSRLYFLSIVFEWSFIPIISFISNYLKDIENIDVIDMNTNFTPFSLDVDYEVSLTK